LEVPTRHSRTDKVLLGLLLLLLVWLYAPVMLSLIQQWWQDDNYQHGFIVPVVSGALLYRRRHELADAKPGAGTVAGVITLAIAAGLLVIGTAASELMTMRLSLPTFIIGILLVLKGSDFVRRALFPLLFLYFMVPLPYIIYYKIAFPMQLFSAKVSAAVLDGLGVNIIRHGNVLNIPGYSLEVVAACSGLRSLMTMIVLSLIIGAIGGLSFKGRVTLLLFAVPAAVIANVVRLTVTGLGAYMVSPSFADGFLHTASGVVVFATGTIVLMAVFPLARRLA
jgi:exosortase